MLAATKGKINIRTHDNHLYLFILQRGKFRPRLTDLVRINTETAVLAISKKAFKKPPKELSQAITALTNLKGVGPATASGKYKTCF